METERPIIPRTASSMKIGMDDGTIRLISTQPTSVSVARRLLRQPPIRSRHPRSEARTCHLVARHPVQRDHLSYPILVCAPWAPQKGLIQLHEANPI